MNEYLLKYTRQKHNNLFLKLIQSVQAATLWGLRSIGSDLVWVLELDGPFWHITRPIYHSDMVVAHLWWSRSRKCSSGRRRVEVRGLSAAVVTRRWPVWHAAPRPTLSLIWTFAPFRLYCRCLGASSLCSPVQVNFKLKFRPVAPGAWITYLLLPEDGRRLVLTDAVTV